MWNKKGVSVVIGYVLLIVALISISFIVYNWMQGFVPQEEDECPGDVSIYIKSYTYENGIIKLTILNKGLFDVDAVKVRGSVDAGRKIGNIEFSDGDKAYFEFDEPLSPTEGGNEKEKIINVGRNDLKFIEIIPYVFEKQAPLGCFNSRVKLKVEFSGAACVPTGPEICDDVYGADEDCNGFSNCDDPNCESDPACAGPPLDLCLGAPDKTYCDNCGETNCYCINQQCVENQCFEKGEGYPCNIDEGTYSCQNEICDIGCKDWDIFCVGQLRYLCLDNQWTTDDCGAPENCYDGFGCD